MNGTIGTKVAATLMMIISRRMRLMRQDMCGHAVKSQVTGVGVWRRYIRRRRYRIKRPGWNKVWMAHLDCGKCKNILIRVIQLDTSIQDKMI